MKKNLLTCLVSLGLISYANAQQVGIGTNTPDASAKLDIASGGNTGILFPRVALTATNAAGPVTSPANWLTVFNTATAGSGSTAVVPGLYYWNGTAWVKLDTGSALGDWKIDGNSNGALRYLGTNDAFDLGFETNGTEKLRLTTAGNLGIGTTTPNAPLQFANTIANRKVVLWETAANDHQIYGLGINTGVLRYQVDATSSNHIFYAGLTTTTSQELMRIQGNGNVGIGTTSPGATLNVIHPTANTTPTKPTGNWAAIVENNQDAADSRNGLAVATRWGGDASTVFEAGSYWTGAVQTYTPILSVKGSLNVGIGITNPLNKLTVNNANTTSGTTSTYPFAVARAGVVDYTIGSDASFAYAQSWNSKPLLINAMGNNVGIGLTTAPTAQLHTTGSVRFAGITNGLLGVDANGNVGTRTMAVSGTGIAITNGNGVAGNPTYNLNYGASLASAAGGAYPVGNFGQFESHGTYTDFNTTPNYWGWNYVVGFANGPNSTSSQWYRQNVGLGSNYAARGAGGYSLEMAYPRYNTSAAGIWMRTIENGTIGPWQRTDGGAKGVSSTLHPSMDDITGWTTILNSCLDDGAYGVNWGFPFNIDGVNYTQGWISTNGVLGFGTGSSSSYDNTALPANISNDPMLFFHWDDNSSNLIRYVIQGTSPNRNCFIQWQGSEVNNTCSGGSSRVMAYITLSEGSNVVSVRYLNQGSSADAQGAGATFGFQYSGGAAAGTIPMGFNTKLLDDNATNQAFSIDF